MATPAAPPPSTTVKSEWILVVIVSLVAAALHLWAFLQYPAATVEGRPSLPSILMTIVMWLGQALWMAMDRNRHGLRMGRWRYGVIFFGPLAVGFYILVQYRLKALYLLPLAALPYLFVLGLPVVIAYFSLGLAH